MLIMEHVCVCVCVVVVVVVVCAIECLMATFMIPKLLKLEFMVTIAKALPSGTQIS